MDLKDKLDKKVEEYSVDEISKMSDEEYQKIIDKEFQDFNRQELINEATQLCLELFEKDISEINPFTGTSTIDELKKFIISLKRQKELKKEAKASTRGKYLLKRKWKALFNKIVLKQPLYCILYFYTFMSAMFFHDFALYCSGIKEDLRIHPALIGPTGTGKSFSNNLLAKMLRRIPKRVYVDSEGEEHIEYFEVLFPSKFTDAGLIGNLDGELYRKQLEKGIKQYIEKDGKQFPNPKYIDPIFEGALKKGDVVIFDEARKVFAPNRDTTDVNTILCNAMNNYGSETNILANDSASSKRLVSYYCSAIVVLTSVPVPKFDELVYGGGLLQRMSIIIDGEDPDKRKIIRKKYLENHITCDEEGNMTILEEKLKEYEKEFNEFIEEVIVLKMKSMIYKENWNPDDRKYMGISPSIVKKADEYCNIIAENNFLTIKQQETHESMISRLMRRILIYTSINALIEGRTIVQISDLDEAYLDLVNAENTSMTDFLRINLVNTKEDDKHSLREKTLKAYLMKNGKVTKTILVKEMSKEWGVSEIMTGVHLKRFKKRKVYVEEQQGTTKYCFMPKEKGNSW